MSHPLDEDVSTLPGTTLDGRPLPHPAPPALSSVARRTPGRIRASLALFVVVASVEPARAVFLDRNGDIELRGRFYLENAIATEDSQSQTKPTRSTGQLIESRTFVNPELDARLTRYQPFPLDDFSFRLALWGFYDGIYEYGTSQYDRSRQSIKGRISQGHTNTAAVTRTDQLVDTRKVYTYQPDPVLGNYGDPGTVSDLPFRINEAYFNFAKGPLFVRVGRQAISWGESDTIALLDQNNPFNLSLGLPGVFQDVDEARIPLWTLRTTYNLFDSWGPFQSGVAEAYLVPGSVDTTVSQLPVPLASPYSPPQDDPQALLAGLIPPDVQAGLVDTAFGSIQLGVYDHLPSRKMSNSRFGFRLGAVVARDYTTSVWYYRTFSQTPVPVFLPLDISRSPIAHPGAPAGRFRGPTQLITSVEHGLVDVIGAATSFFSEPLRGIIRAEAEYFLNEPAFIPNQNVPFENLLRTPQLRELLNALGQNVTPGPTAGSIPYADFLRFELGYDRFFFFRPLNPTNSITWITAFVGSWNLSETFTGKDFRAYGQQKIAPGGGLRIGANTAGLSLATIGKLHTVNSDFVDLHPFTSFVQTHFQTDYLHGRLTPSLTCVIGLDGNYVVPVGITYRFSDALLFDAKYVYLGGSFMLPSGFFRDRSQLSARITYLLN